MNIHLDASKRIRQNLKRRLRNRSYRTRIRNQVKAVRTAVNEGNVDQAQTALRGAMSVLHKGASKGVIHRNQAARRIARLNASVKTHAQG